MLDQEELFAAFRVTGERAIRESSAVWLLDDVDDAYRRPQREYADPQVQDGDRIFHHRPMGGTYTQPRPTVHLPAHHQLRDLLEADKSGSDGRTPLELVVVARHLPAGRPDFGVGEGGTQETLECRVRQLMIDHVGIVPCPSSVRVMTAQQPPSRATARVRQNDRVTDVIAETIARIQPLDAQATADAEARQAQLTKPAGALGVLEDVSIRLAGIQRACPPAAPTKPAVAVFAGDHGVLAQGVTPWPQEVTAGMVENFRAGGAAVNVLARACGADVLVVDIGVASDVVEDDIVISRKVRRATADLAEGPAMSSDEARKAVAIGIQVADRLDRRRSRPPPHRRHGDRQHHAQRRPDRRVHRDWRRGRHWTRTGVDDETLARKTAVVRRAAERVSGDVEDPIELLAEVGGLEHAGLAGLILGSAARKVPVLLDGVIAGSAALVAQRLAPTAVDYCFAGHRSVEPGHVTALAQLGLRPLVDLDLRLGEGSGAALAVPLVQAAALLLAEMATFDAAGVAHKDA